MHARSRPPHGFCAQPLLLPAAAQPIEATSALKRAIRSHRLAVQDVALSRRKLGFDSPWERQSHRKMLIDRKVLKSHVLSPRSVTHRCYTCVGTTCPDRCTCTSGTARIISADGYLRRRLPHWGETPSWCHWERKTSHKRSRFGRGRSLCLIRSSVRR